MGNAYVCYSLRRAHRSLWEALQLLYKLCGQDKQVIVHGGNLEYRFRILMSITCKQLKEIIRGDEGDLFVALFDHFNAVEDISKPGPPYRD